MKSYLFCQSNRVTNLNTKQILNNKKVSNKNGFKIKPDKSTCRYLVRFNSISVHKQNTLPQKSLSLNGSNISESASGSKLIQVNHHQYLFPFIIWFKYIADGSLAALHSPSWSSKHKSKKALILLVCSIQDYIGQRKLPKGLNMEILKLVPNIFYMRFQYTAH